jgi:hypothetical protein
LGRTPKTEQSAVKALLSEKTVTNAIGEHLFAGYECNACGMGEVFESLSEGERHCWNEGESHYNANIDKVEQESQHDINKINAELRKDIQEAIQAKYDTEYKKQLAKERAARDKLKSELPFGDKLKNGLI